MGGGVVKGLQPPWVPLLYIIPEGTPNRTFLKISMAINGHKQNLEFSNKHQATPDLQSE